VTIVGLSGKTAIKQAADWIIPDGTNGADEMNAATLDAYAYDKDIPFANIGANNVGMVKLATSLTDKEVDGSKFSTFFNYPNTSNYFFSNRKS